MRLGTAVALLFASATLAHSGGALAQTATKKHKRPPGVQATWYGGHFCKQQTASGEMMDCGALTAAHHSYRGGPPKLARVTSLVNGKSIVVRVNDHKPGSGIDLVPAARDAIGLTKHRGTMPVTVEFISRPASLSR